MKSSLAHNVELNSLSLDNLTEAQKEKIIEAVYNTLWPRPLYTKSPDKILEFADRQAEKRGTDRHTQVMLYIFSLKECSCKPKT